MDDTDWVAVRTLRHTAEAEIVRALLESEDIPVMVQSELVQQVYPGLGAIAVLVPKTMLCKAQQILEKGSASEDELP